jgi:Protein of unknown function (DUF3800)
VIRAYFDDSGKESNPTNGYVCMAGYLAESSYWELFNWQWRQRLLQYGISAIHMKNLISLKGEYQFLGWDANRRDDALKDFVRVIKETRGVGFGVGVEMSGWREIRSRHPELPDVQTFCFARTARMVIDRLKVSAPREFLNMHFDADPEFGPARIRLHSALWERDETVRPYLSALTFADVYTFLPLQAADLLAWETRKDLVQKSGGHNSTSRWEELFTALENVHLDYQSELWSHAELISREQEIVGLGI